MGNRNLRNYTGRDIPMVTISKEIDIDSLSLFETTYFYKDQYNVDIIKAEGNLNLDEDNSYVYLDDKNNQIVVSVYEDIELPERVNDGDLIIVSARTAKLLSGIVNIDMAVPVGYICDMSTKKFVGYCGFCKIADN